MVRHHSVGFFSDRAGNSHKFSFSLFTQNPVRALFCDWNVGTLGTGNNEQLSDNRTILAVTYIDSRFNQHTLSSYYSTSAAKLNSRIRDDTSTGTIPSYYYVCLLEPE